MSIKYANTSRFMRYDFKNHRGHGILTVRIWSRKCLLMIGIESLDVQQVKDVLGIAWKCLELWNHISTFLEFLPVFSQLLTPLTLVLLVCQCSICTLEWIRFTNLLQIFSNNYHWSWFDSHVNLSKSSQYLIFLCTNKPCTICSYFQLFMDLIYAQSLKV